jgi:predicted phosphoribosyltransferase
MKRFHDREEAGQALARELRKYAGRNDVIVLGLPRGGIPVAYEAAVSIGAKLDVFVVRKLGAPDNEEYAIGALASGGICVVDRESATRHHITDAQIASIIEKEAAEVARRDRIYRGSRRFPDLPGQVVILIDDGLATGATMRAAVAAVKKRRPALVIVAAPVASREACATIGKSADECVCVIAPRPFHAVGTWYDDFSQVTDQEVTELLERASSRAAEPAAV